MSIAIGLFIFPEVELLDFAGPYEVFTTAVRVIKRRDPLQPAPFTVFTVAQTATLITTRAGIAVQPNYIFANHPHIDVLLVPGGVIDKELASDNVIAWIGHIAATARITASICTGSFLLAQAGLLNQRSATTHWEDIAEMRAKFPAVNTIEQQRWVDEDSVLTSAGISAGIDMSLHLVERLIDRDAAIRTARQMDFLWRESSGESPHEANLLYL